MSYKFIKRVKPIKKPPAEFDPFEIYPDHLQESKPILLVDLGYATFYRFNATKKWYKSAHPEEKEELSNKDYDWGENKIFMTMFEKKYLDYLLTLAKQFKVPKHNIIMAQDCSSCHNWRSKLYDDYKLPRQLERQKNGFDGESVFKFAFETTFKSLAKNYGFKLLKHKEIEADDINGIITTYYRQNYPKINVYILATDKDYLQLSRPGFYLIDFKGNILNLDANNNPVDGEEQLWTKILTGDKSDHIPPIRFKNKYIKPNAKRNAEDYVNANKNNIKLYTSDLKKFHQDLIDYDDLIEDKNQLALNQHLIDFEMIPQKYQKYVIKKIQNLLGK